MRARTEPSTPRSLLVLACLSLGFSSALASAQDAAAIVVCDKTHQRVLIEYFPSRDADQPAVEGELVEFWSLLEYERCTAEEPYPGDPCRVTGSRKHTAECKLDRTTFLITLEPAAPNANLQGRCGAAVTGSISVLRNDQPYFEDVTFEDMNCHERKLHIRSIELHDDERAPVVLSELDL